MRFMVVVTKGELSVADKWTWGKDDVEWDRSPPAKDGPKLKPLLDAEGIKIAEENFKRIREGKPLLNGSPAVGRF